MNISPVVPTAESLGLPPLSSIFRSLSIDVDSIGQSVERDEMLQTLGLDESVTITVKTPIDDQVIMRDSINHMAGVADSALVVNLPQVLSSPAEIWITGRRRVFIAPIRRVKRRWLMLRINIDGSMLWRTTSNIKVAESWRSGLLLWSANGRF